jgi:uncharacterized HAD superfamily protein
MPTVAVDIDGVLCEETGTFGDYAYRKPMKAGLDLVRELNRQGHTVVLYTARWAEDAAVTQNWLDSYKVQYERVVYDKPLANVYVDDRAMRWEQPAKDFSRLMGLLNAS